MAHRGLSPATLSLALAFLEWLLRTVEELYLSLGTSIAPSLPFLFGSLGFVCNGRRVETRQKCGVVAAGRVHHPLLSCFPPLCPPLPCACDPLVTSWLPNFCFPPVLQQPRSSALSDTANSADWALLSGLCFLLLGPGSTLVSGSCN